MFIDDMFTTKDHHYILLIVKVLVIIFLTLAHIQCVCCGITDQIDNQFNKYAFIEPKLFNARHKREIQSTKINPNGLEHAHGITLIFVDKQQEYIIDLSLNRGLIPVNYFEKHQKDGAHVINRPKANELEFCNYNGKIRDFPNSWAAISTCDGIRGMFFDGISYHYIENVERASGDKYHILYKHEDFRTNHTCGFPSAPEFTTNKIKRNKRNTRSLKGPYNQNDKSRFIELVFVVDKEEYKFFRNDLSKVYQHTKAIANIINSLYIPLNIFIMLVGVVVWTEHNDIELMANGDTTLTNFLTYRRERLVKDHPNDNAQLLTKIQFENGVVGKALKGPICTYEFSGGVNSDHSLVHGLVATTIAHEIGHNLGMEHDDIKNCDCPGERCIMAPSSGTTSPTHWSSCSMEYLALAFEHGMDYCLRNKPVRLFESPECGNSFVEDGEQCDCGSKDMCSNPCCNPETCMFYENATNACATGQCCDLNTCRFKSAGVECRSAPHECDLPEYCTGVSEYCPDNVFKFDGSTCKTNQAFCFDGSCRTHADQCRLLWGPTGESSADECYNMNTKGSQQGNCGYNHLNKSYVKCTTKNVLCGMLQCKHKNERLEFGLETVSSVSYTFIHNDKGLMIPCRTAIVDLGLNDVDPGLTPDGALCGENMMCVKQKCIAVKDFRAQNNICENDCNGNGVCNSKGNCHCKTGYAPPYCDHPGPGGSDDSGPASSPNTFKGFMTGMYVLTFGAIPLLLAVLLFAYCSKNHRSPSNWNKSNRKKLSNDSEVGNKPNGTVSPSSTLLIDNQKPPTLHADLVGNYKGFSIKPLVLNEQPVVSRTPIRPAPSAPAIVSALNERGGRLQISQPVLDATTSSAVHKLVLVPSKPAPPVPTAARPASLMAVENKNSGVGGGGGYPTLRRITSFMKNQKTDEKKHTIPRANAKFDKEVLKKLEISHPILQKEINVPSEPLPLEADQHKAVVLRAQSLRIANNGNHRPRLPNFGSMKCKRPTSVAATATAAASAVSCSRPTSPPPPRPPASNAIQVQVDYQIPRPLVADCRRDGDLPANVSCEEPLSENIYSVIDELPAVDVDEDDSCAYKVPRSLESSLLGEIVSAIQERNHESIYTSKPAIDQPPQQQTYENYKSSSVGSTTSSGYMRPVDVKSRAASYDQPDLVKNCDENRSLNPSPDVLEAKKQPTADKPTILFPKPVVGVTSKLALTATVGLKKKLSDGSRYPSKGVANIQKRFESHGNVLKNPPVSAKPTITGNR